ncbi:MAG: PAS domain S-box protein [SAR324 cluster bacterium]|nr:PAS domain S-box protein [SAR324 cluster bacterium]
MRDNNKTKKQLLQELDEVKQQLLLNEKKYRLLFEKNLDAYAFHQIIIDENNQPIDYVFLEINENFEKFTGLKKEEVIGKRITTIIPGIEKTYTDLIHTYGEVALHGGQKRFDLYFEPWEKWYTVSVYSPEKKYFVVIFEDITESKQAAEKLERQVKRRTRELQDSLEQLRRTQDQLIVQEKLASLGTITAGIAHEIKNPLNFINNYAELCEDFLLECERKIDQHTKDIDSASRKDIAGSFKNLKHSTKVISEHGKRIERIIKSMLLHSGGQQGEWEPTDLNNLLYEYANLSYHGIRAQHFSFSAVIEDDFDDSVGLVDAVPQDLGQVFLNLFNNAFDALLKKLETCGPPFAPKLGLVTQRTNDRVEIRIKDNGIGMPEDVAPQVFLPFYTTKPPGKGTGLGLSISHEIIVQGHRGSIQVKSEEGEYTEFVITLPMTAH